MDNVGSIPVEVDGLLVYVEVRSLDGPAGTEQPIGIRPPSLDKALDGVMAVARNVGGRLRDSGAQKATAEFGFELGLESGSLVAMIGKVNSSSTFKVTLEWADPTAG